MLHVTVLSGRNITQGRLADLGESTRHAVSSSETGQNCGRPFVSLIWFEKIYVKFPFCAVAQDSR